MPPSAEVFEIMPTSNEKESPSLDREEAWKDSAISPIRVRLGSSI